MAYEQNGYKVTFIVPLKYNDGSPISASALSLFATGLRELQSGFTHVPAQGEWRSGTDESRMYMVTVPKWHDVTMLKAFVTSAAKLFGQEAMYFDVCPVYFELLTH